MAFPIPPPIEPMLAKPTPELPVGDGWRYEPKWDGFRALVFRDGSEVYLQSRDLKPLNRYFPELDEPLRRVGGPDARFVLDGEVVIARDGALDFDSLLLRIHAASRVAMLAEQTPSSFVAFDCLADDAADLRDAPFDERRERLERLVGDDAPSSVLLTPSTSDAALARRWFDEFEGAGLDGVIAKRGEGPYVPAKREMAKIKHLRTADCVVAGFRWHKNGPGTMVGSLLLGLWNDAGHLQHVGVTSSFKTDQRRELVAFLEPYRRDAMEDHPWREWKEFEAQWEGKRMPGAGSRWNRGKDLSWEPLRPELVCEVAFDHLQGDRFRHGTTFRRWRPDKSPADCRYDQLEETPAALLADLFGR
jgi:ATP-dependent DNA ligase